MKDRATFKNTKEQGYVQEHNETEHKVDQEHKYRTLHKVDNVVLYCKCQRHYEPW